MGLVQSLGPLCAFIRVPEGEGMNTLSKVMAFATDVKCQLSRDHSTLQGYGEGELYRVRKCVFLAVVSVLLFIVDF